jgi:hypothetical protein
MLVSGLVAFGLYRLVKHVNPLSDPVTLLGVSGLISALAAAGSYRVGRRASFAMMWREDGMRRLSWLIGWIGFVYGVQLSLMVLALLKILVNYDFLLHPDGPAMMAIIIACTSAARDAFEIGHVRKLQQTGRPVLTFPDGASLRVLFHEEPVRLLQWSLVGGAICALFASVMSTLGESGRSDIGQLVTVTAVAGTVALWAYLAGEQQTGGLWARLGEVGLVELFRFWWWPGLAFAATYYLVLAGVVMFLFRVDGMGGTGQVVMAGLVATIMALYGYYLGYRRFHEDRIQQAVPASLLRCPFVMGILSKNGRNFRERALASTEMALGEPGRRN